MNSVYQIRSKIMDDTKVIIFVGSSSSQGDFFSEIWYHMDFFMYSNTLEIHVINLRGEDSLNSQKYVQKI